MTRDELIELARKIKFAEGKDEKEMDENIDIFLKNVPDPNAANYFFSKKFEGMSIEEIVDKSLSHKPIQL